MLKFSQLQPQSYFVRAFGDDHSEKGPFLFKKVSDGLGYARGRSEIISFKEREKVYPVFETVTPIGSMFFVLINSKLQMIVAKSEFRTEHEGTYFPILDTCLMPPATLLVSH